MDSLFGAFFFLGSYSFGYLILKTAFPNIQSHSALNKMIISYVLGILIFGIGLFITIESGINSDYYIIATLIILTMLFTVALAKRILLDRDKITFDVKERPKSKTYVSISPPVQKKVAKKEAKEINFEHGLIVKTKEGKEAEKQVFKEKEANTSSQAAQSEEKKNALIKLRNAAIGIGNVKKENKKESDELEEDLLEDLEKLDNIKEEEEY
jgi:hypothetical protein